MISEESGLKTGRTNEKTVEDYRQLIRLLKLKATRMAQTKADLQAVLLSRRAQSFLPLPAVDTLPILALKNPATLSGKQLLLKTTQEIAVAANLPLQRLFAFADRRYQRWADSRTFLSYLKRTLGVKNAMDVLRLFDQSDCGRIDHATFINVLRSYKVHRANQLVELGLDSLVLGLGVKVARLERLQLDQVRQIIASSARPIKDYQAAALYNYLYQDGRLIEQSYDKLSREKDKLSSLDVSSIEEPGMRRVESLETSPLLRHTSSKLLEKARRRLSLPDSHCSELLSLLRQKHGLGVEDLVDLLTSRDRTLQYRGVFTFRFFRQLFRGVSMTVLEIHALFKLIDEQEEGSFRIEDLLHFFLLYKGQKDPILPAFRLIALAVHASGAGPEEFFRLRDPQTQQLNYKPNLSEEQFYQLVAGKLGIEAALLRPVYAHLEARSPTRGKVSRDLFFQKLLRNCAPLQSHIYFKPETVISQLPRFLGLIKDDSLLKDFIQFEKDLIDNSRIVIQGLSEKKQVRASLMLNDPPKLRKVLDFPGKEEGPPLQDKGSKPQDDPKEEDGPPVREEDGQVPQTEDKGEKEEEFAEFDPSEFE